MTTKNKNVEFDSDYQSWPPKKETVRCPFHFFDMLREKSPVYKFPSTSPDGETVYIITRYDECCQVLMNTKLFQNFVRSMQDFEPLPLPDHEVLYNRQSIFFTDGDDHSAKRSWALKFVEPEKLKSYRPMIQSAVDKLIDQFVNKGHCDFIEEFTEQMSMTIIRQLMGLPKSADSKIRRMSNAIPEIDNNPHATEAQIQEVIDSSRDILELCASLVLERHSHPTDDFISEIVQMQVERDGQLDPNTLSLQLMVMIFGADHAMGAHLSQTMAHLADDPELQERVRENRSLIWPLALESLRFDNPVPYLHRRCTENTVLGDVEIAAGSLILVSTIAANLDGKKFPEPYQFNIDRPKLDVHHLSMGRGNHRCVGSPMARIQAEITVNSMLDRLDDIRLDKEKSNLDPLYSLGFRVPEAVHLTFKAKQ